MNVKDLENWYSSPEYDPEGKELRTLVRHSSPKNRHILVVGEYPLLTIAPKLQKFADTVTGFHHERKVVSHCKKKYPGIKFKAGDLAHLPFNDRSFERIIILWEGLHYKPRLKNLLQELRRVLTDDGILIIEEADFTSEYVNILNLLDPYKKDRLQKRQNAFNITVGNAFSIKVHSLHTFYHFKKNADFKNYFKHEIVYAEKKRFTFKMEAALDRYLSRKRILKVGEKSLFFVCRKFN